MRLAALLVLAGCEFQHGSLNPAPPDTIPDVPVDVAITWSVDTTSGKATPATTQEWTDFLVAAKLSMQPPSALWPLQESSGPLVDVVGSVDMSSFGAPSYQQSVTGWTRKAIATMDGTLQGFSNTTDAALPDVQSTSMTILAYYQTQSAPAAARSVLFAGCCGQYATLDVLPGGTLSFRVDQTIATGGISYTSVVVPIVFKLDVAHAHQSVVTDRETIAPAFDALGPNRGVFLGGANNAAPAGRWLYMVAWFGSAAEFDDATANSLLDALGW